VHAQGASECDTLFWAGSRPLHFQDYKDNPDTSNHRRQAFTLIRIGYHISQPADSIIIRVDNYFLPCRSWISNKNTSLIIHEQIHFDISEYFRRLFIKKISETNFSISVLSTVAKAIFHDLLDQKKVMEEQFDKETMSGTNSGAQAGWRDKVARLLIETKNYNIAYKSFASS
jgi:hypothetical protein